MILKTRSNLQADLQLCTITKYFQSTRFEIEYLAQFGIFEQHDLVQVCNQSVGNGSGLL